MWKPTLWMDRAARSALENEVRSIEVVPTFADIYRDQIGFVWRCLRALGVRDAALDDAAQEVFVIVHRRLPEFRGDSHVRTWLYGVVRNVAANQRRSQRRKERSEPLAPDLRDPRPDPLDQLAQREDAAFIRSFAAGLDEKKRDVFVLALIEQMAIPLVAEALGIPLNTAYTRLRKVRLEFQQALRERRGEP